MPHKVNPSSIRYSREYQRAYHRAYRPNWTRERILKNLCLCCSLPADGDSIHCTYHKKLKSLKLTKASKKVYFMKLKKTKLPNGTKVRITQSPNSYALQCEGEIVHPFENGYAVRTKVAEKEVTVWAEGVEEL